ncbi:hypothetical protein BDW66DRAFT_1854 [Aspergillus desertorum]
MSDPTLYLYTSLTAGSSHIITATSRLETILKANKIPFRAIDVATDDAARKLWGRRSRGKKLPGLVKYGTVVGDLEQIEEWNEFGELKMQINSVEPFDDLPATDTPLPLTEPNTTSASAPKADAPASKTSKIKIQEPREKESQVDDSVNKALRQAAEEAAAKAKEPPAKLSAPAAAEPKASASTSTSTSAPKTDGDAGPKEGGGEQSVRRMSVAPEIAEFGSKRPPLVPEYAAESSANFRADNAEALGLINHHRNSNIAAESKEEAERLVRELRKSISAPHNPALEFVREQKATLAAEATVEDALEG